MANSCTNESGEMVHTKKTGLAFPRPLIGQSIYAPTVPTDRFPINIVHIDWGRLIAMRPAVLKRVNGMPGYLLHPEIQILLEGEKNPTYRLIMDLMWTLGATISEVLALKPEDFLDAGKGVKARLKTLRSSGRPLKNSKAEERCIPINDSALLDRLECYLEDQNCRQDRRMFTMCRQTVNRHIHGLESKLGLMPIPISAQTFRHSFAVHLILHGRPLFYVSKLLGHKSVKSTEIYTNVLAIEDENLLEGIDFH